MTANDHHHTERRQYPRYKLKHEVFATLLPGRARQGQIQDISKGGLAFFYLSSGDWASDPAAIDIFAEDGQVSMTDVPCQSVRDTIVEQGKSTGILHMRMHAVRFSDLTPQQEMLLKSLIKNYSHNPN